MKHSTHNETWYEIAESYANGGGTMTIESTDTLEEAKEYVSNYDFSAEPNVEFVFIDKWVEVEGATRKDTSFEAVITNHQRPMR